MPAHKTQIIKFVSSHYIMKYKYKIYIIPFGELIFSTMCLWA